MESNNPSNELFIQAVELINSASDKATIEKAIKQLEEIQVEAQKNDDRNLLGNCLFFKSRAYRTLNNDNKALELLETLLSIATSVDTNKNLICGANLEIAELSRKQKHSGKAIKHFHEALEFFIELGDTESAANIHIEVSDIYLENNETEKAIKSLHEAAAIAGEQDINKLLDVNFRIGHIYYLASDFNNAILYEEIALKYAREINSLELMLRLTNNLANFSIETNNYRKYIIFLNDLLSLYQNEKNDDQQVSVLLRLGSAYSEIGDSTNALGYYEKARIEIERTHKINTLEYAMYLMGVAHIYADIKDFEKGKQYLSNAKQMLTEYSIDMKELVNRLNKRIEDGENPFRLECSHRIVSIALSNAQPAADEIKHRNPHPLAPSPDSKNIDLGLTNDEREKFDAILDTFQNGIFSDLAPIKITSTGNKNYPGTFMLPLKFEYVDDVEDFEVKWALFKQEKLKKHTLQELHDIWERESNKLNFNEGLYTGDKEALIKYIDKIISIAIEYARIGERESARDFALHAANFLEVQTDDKFALLVFWKLRAKLLVGIYSLAKYSAKEQLRLEINYSLSNAMKLIQSLDDDAQSFASQLLEKEWWDYCELLEDKSAFQNIIKLIENIQTPLEVESLLIHGLALNRLERYSDATVVLEKAISLAYNTKKHQLIPLVQEAQTALANSRVLSNCPNLENCAEWLGPFAPYIYSEIAKDSIEKYWWLGQPDCGDKIPTIKYRLRAFVDDNLVVMGKNLESDIYTATLMHETTHSLKRMGGQSLLTESGKWYPVKRDVPIASADTFVILLEEFGNTVEQDIYPGLNQFLTIGRNSIVNRKQSSNIFIKNMLQYFDDLGPQETPSSYPCAAILVGMAFGLLGEEKYEEVKSYINHLAIFDHEDALKCGKNKEELRL